MPKVDSMKSLLRTITNYASRSDLRLKLAAAVTKIPNLIKFPVRIDGGLRLLIYPRYEELRYLAHDNEAETRTYLKEVLSDGDTFIDAGAHIGYYSMIAADIVGESGSVVAFEPHPDNASRIRENAQANSLDVTVVNAAVDAKSGWVKLTVADNSLSHSISPSKSGDTRAWSLDDYFVKHDLSPDIVKLDVEGSEVDVARGMYSTLESHRPTVVIEIHPWINPDDAIELYEIFEQSDYFIRTPDGKSLSKSKYIESYRSESALSEHLLIAAIPREK